MKKALFSLMFIPVFVSCATKEEVNALKQEVLKQREITEKALEEALKNRELLIKLAKQLEKQNKINKFFSQKLDTLKEKNELLEKKLKQANTIQQAFSQKLQKSFDKAITTLKKVEEKQLKALIVSSNALLRIIPSPKGKIIAKIPENQQVSIIEKTTAGRWFKVKYQNLTGWIYYTNIKMQEEKNEKTDNSSSDSNNN